MKDTVKINRDALEQLTDFVRKDIEVAHLETSDNEDLTYIIQAKGKCLHKCDKRINGWKIFA